MVQHADKGGRKTAHASRSWATDLPVSMYEDARLFAKTSGATSRRQWPVASRRRMWPVACESAEDSTLGGVEDSLKLAGVNGAVSSGAAVLRFARSSKIWRWISWTCNPLGPASRRISTMFAVSRKRMAEENWP